MTAPSRAKRRRLGYWAIALVVAAVALYVSLRGIDWREVWRLISHAAPAYLLLSFGVASVALFLRAVRWRLLLTWGAPVRLPLAFVATAVGYCGNLFLPARAGELVRTVMISRASGLSKAFVLTTALCERLSDAIALVLISSAALLLLPVKPGWFSRAATPFAVIGFIGVLAIATLPRLGDVCRRWGSRLPMPRSFQAKLLAYLDHVLTGLRSFHDAKRLLLFIALTGIVWLADAWTVIFIMRALGLPGTLTIALLLTTGLALGSALPSTPGYIGIYQFVAVSVLTPFGFSKTNAIAYILLFQVLQYVVMPFWAAWGTLVSRSAPLPEAESASSSLNEGSA